jgi:hypothetical protein
MVEALEASCNWCGLGEVPCQTDVAQEDKGGHKEEAWKEMRVRRGLSSWLGLPLPSSTLVIFAHPFFLVPNSPTHLKTSLHT